MQELLLAFQLGNVAILSNVCMLPLYPGMVAYLAGQDTGRRGALWLGVLVLAGILTMMLLIGFVLYLLNQAFGSVLTVLLPLIYIAVILLGVVMLFGVNPFEKLAQAQMPVLRNPFATAYVYGLLFGPMTLPCTGPIVTSVFLIGAGNTAELVNGLLYFLAFGLGFGWPLALLPLLARPLQRRFTGFLTRHHTTITRLAGALLVGVGVFGIVSEVLPNVFGIYII